MEEVNELLELAMLYDFYGELLKEHNKQIFEDYILNDLSLSEIADAEGITRQGVHDVVKRCSKQLRGYEEKLHLVEKFIKIQENAKEINLILDEMKQIGEHDLLMQKCDEIRVLSDGMIEEL